MAWATLTKQFTFHAAHRLPNHDGPCRNLHGHSYVLEVAVTGTVKGATGETDEGMVVDFAVLKDIYARRIEPFVEHQYMNETLDGVLPRSRDGEPLTTAENLATWMRNVFLQALDPLHITNVKIRLWETSTSSAKVG